MSLMTRLLVSAICAVSLAIAGVSLERLGARPVRTGGPLPTTSGAWSCPHGGGEGWRVWVTVTNPGDAPVQVRMTTSAGAAAAPATSSVVEPGTLTYFEVTAPLEGSATVVEYLGGAVVASTVVTGPEGGLAAASCAGSPGTLWHTVEGSSLRGETALLVVHNPFAAQAVVDVILTAGERQIRPGRLQGVVLGALDARAFELNNFALGEEALTATVVAPQGRVAAASVVLSPGGVRSSLAVAEPATRWMLPGAGAEMDVLVRALEQDSPVSAELQGEAGAIPAIDLEAVSAGTAESFGVLAGEGGLVVEADGPRPMLAGRRMLLEKDAPAQEEPQRDQRPARDRGGRSGGQRGEGRDQQDRPADGSGQNADKKKKEKPPPPPPTVDIAGTEGSTVVSDRWVAPPAVTPEGGSAIVLVQNPGDKESQATVTFMSTTGSLADPVTVTIPPRSTVSVSVPGGQPASALVEGRGLVAGQAALSGEAFSVLLGLPLVSPGSS